MMLRWKDIFQNKILYGLLFSCMLLAGCGVTVQEQALKKAALVIRNYDFQGVELDVKFNDVPKKAVVCGNNALDTLLALGAQESIAAAVVDNAKAAAKYRQLLPQAELYIQPLAQEKLLTLAPDFILAPRRYFSDKVFGDTRFWQQNGVPAYIQDASGPIPSLGNFPPCTVESEKNFIRNMGKIFHQEREAAALIAAVEQKLQQPIKERYKPKVLAVEFMNGNIEVFGKNLLSGDIVTKLGGEIVDFGAPFISLEDLIQTDADVVFVVYHGGKEAERAALEKMQRKIFRQIKGVWENKVYPLPYNIIVAAGAHTPETIKIIRRGMYGR